MDIVLMCDPATDSEAFIRWGMQTILSAVHSRAYKEQGLPSVEQLLAQAQFAGQTIDILHDQANAMNIGKPQADRFDCLIGLVVDAAHEILHSPTTTAAPGVPSQPAKTPNEG